MIKILIDYPSVEAEREIVLRWDEGFNARKLEEVSIEPLPFADTIAQCRAEVKSLKMEPGVRNYTVEIVCRTRARGRRHQQYSAIGGSPAAEEQKMKVILLATWIALMLVCSFGVTATAQELKAPKDTRQEAERLWEQAIAAKGGRERLYAIENMVVSSQLQGRKNLIQKVELPAVELYVFPHKVWRWEDYRQTSFGRLEVSMFDIERSVTYYAYPNDPTSPRKGTEIYPRERQYVFYTQLLYLMETKWQKPRLLATRTERSGFKKYDVVQTVVDNERVDFYLDRKTHLPVKIVEQYIGKQSEKTYDIVFNLDDYADVNGIQMPQKVETTGGMMDGLEYIKQQTNVAYDKSIFERPPSIEAGAEAWKPKQ